MQEHGPQDIARFFDGEACCAARRRVATGRRLGGAARALLDLLVASGLHGRTVLDAGCGQGGLAVAVRQRGAAAVTGIDLSTGSIAAAREAAERAQVAVHFAVADAAVDTVEPHDVVLLSKVVCCYFDAEALLANTAPAARALLGLALPHSRGPRGLLARVLIAGENAWRRARGDPFRAFVHDCPRVMRVLDAHGLRPVATREHWTVARRRARTARVTAWRRARARHAMPVPPRRCG